MTTNITPGQKKELLEKYAKNAAKKAAKNKARYERQQAAPVVEETARVLAFTKWVHPTTGEIRVYVNNLPMLSSETKVYFVMTATGPSHRYASCGDVSQSILTRRNVEQALAAAMINNATIESLLK